MIKIRGKVIKFVKVLHLEHWSTGTGEHKSIRDSCYVIYDEHDSSGKLIAQDQVMYFSRGEIEYLSI